MSLPFSILQTSPNLELKKEFVHDIMAEIQNPTSYIFNDYDSMPIGTSASTSAESGMVEGLFPSSKKAAQDLSKAAQSISNLEPGMKETMDAYKKSAEAIEQASHQFSSMIDNIKKMLSEMPIVRPFLAKILDALTIIYDVIMAVLNKFFFSIPTLIVRLFQLFSVDTVLINSFVKSVVQTSCSLQTAEGTVILEQQGAQLQNLFSEGLGILMLGKTPDIMQMRYVNEAMRLKKNYADNIKSISDLALAALENLPAEIQVWMQYVMPIRWWMNVFQPGSEYYRWIDEVNSLDEHACTIKAAYHIPLQKQIERLYKQGQDLLKLCTTSGPKMSQVFRLLETTFRKIDALYKIVDMSALHTVTRPVPFVIYLHGKTGQGKSFLSTILPSILAECSFDEPNLSYARNAASAHWDGYTGQFAVQYDDYGAVASANITPGENAEIMQIVSNEQMRLPMASLEDKGEVFRSQVVILSSNMDYLSPNEMRDRKALWRRRHAFYTVTVKPEYRKPGKDEVDPDLIPKDCSHWQFVEKDPVIEGAEGVIGRPIEYLQWIMEIKQKFADHRRQQQLATLNYKNMINLMQVPVQRVLEVQGLLESDMMETVKKHLSDEIIAGKMTSTVAHDLYLELKKIEEEHETPAWIRALEIVVPVLTIFGAGFAFYKIYKRWEPVVSKKFKRKGDDEDHRDAGKKILLVKNILAHPRIKKMDAEGRWRKLYEDLEGMTEPLVEHWDKAMDEFPDFAAMTDEEVEELIDTVLRKPSVVRRLKKEGVYSAHHFHGGFRGQLRPPIVQLKAEGCIDNCAMEVTTNRIIPSLASVYLGGQRLVGMCVGGRMLLTPYHFFLNMVGLPHGDGEILEVTIGTTKHRFSFMTENLLRVGKDVAIYNMDVSIQPFKDSTNSFITEADLDFRKPFPALMATLTPQGIPMIVQIDGTVSGNTERVGYFLDMGMEKKARNGELLTDKAFDPQRDQVVEQHTGWAYKMQTYKGICGSPIIQLNKIAARKIVGIHVAGDASAQALATPVTREMLEKAARHFGMSLAVIPTPLVVKEGVAVMDVQGNFTKVGRLLRPIFINEKTKIVPSILHGKIFPVKTAPSVLSKWDIRSFADEHPMKMGVEKYGDPAPPVNMKILKEVENHLIMIFDNFEGFGGRGVLSEVEALNGIPGDEFTTHMDMSTSAGFPYNQRHYVKGKFPIIQGDQNNLNYRVADCELRENIDLRWEEALQGRRVPSIWLDSLKDERRTFPKIMQSKTRVFTIPPVDYTIVARRLLSSFTSAFYKNRLDYFSAVGINPASLEWTRLYNKLSTNSMLGFAGDYSGWDGHLSPQFIMSVCNIINAWYKDDLVYQRARIVLFEEMIHTMQCAFDCVYITHIGNPSGNPLTVVINTLVHGAMKRYFYLNLAPDNYSSLVLYDENVVDMEYGDDDINSVKNEILFFFNPKNIYEQAKKLGMEYTNSEKSGAAELKKINLLTFLKRGFRDDGFGKFLPVIDMQTITELVNWTRECKDITLEKASIDNLNDSLAFMYFYGKQQFEFHKDKLIKVLDRKFHHLLFGFDYFNRLYNSSDIKMNPHYVKIMQVQGDTKTTISTAEVNQAEDARVVDNTLGIVNLSQRAEEVSGPTIQPITGARLVGPCVGDPQWSLSDMVNRKVWINTYSWAVTNSMGDSLVTLSLPKDIIVNYLQSAPFERFLYWRGSIILHFELSGMRQQSGLLMIYHVPYTINNFVNVWQKTNFAAAFGLNPLFLDPSVNPKDKLVVPFYNPKTFISLSGITNLPTLDQIGTTVVQVLVPLKSAECAPQAINLVVWAEFAQDAKFYVPLHSAATGFKTFNAEHARQTTDRVRVMEKQGGTVSSIQNYYGNIENSTIPTSMTGDDFSGMASGNDMKADIVPLDHPARTMNPINIVRKYIQNFANSNGSEGLTRLDLNPSNMNLSLRDHFSTNQDELKLKFLLCQPTWVANIPWLGSAAFGTSLYSSFIGPMCSMFNVGASTQKLINYGSRVPLTQWEYNAMRFAYWRGGMRIRIHIVATQFHVGRLALTLNYGAPPEAEIGLRDATSQYAQEFEVSNEKRIFEFDIPYIAPTPVLQMCCGPKRPEDSGPVEAWWANYFPGSWNLRVVSQLQTVCNSPPDATIVLSYCGAPDFEVYMPSNNNSTLVGVSTSDVTPPPMRIMEVQGSVKDSGDDAVAVTPIINATKSKAFVIAPEGSHIPPITQHFGKNAFINDRRQVWRRYYRQPEALSTRGNWNDMKFSVPLLQGNALPLTDQYSAFTSRHDLTAAPTLMVEFLAYTFQRVCPGFSTEGAIATYNYQVRGAALPLIHDALQFRFWRGSLNYKAIFGPLTDQEGNEYASRRYGITHIPHSAYELEDGDPSTRPNFAQLALNYAQTLSPNTADLGGELAAVGIVTATDTAEQNIVNYSEIQVPFATRYNVMSTTHSTFRLLETPSATSAGMIMAYQWFRVPAGKVMALVTTPNGRLFSDNALLSSVGDDFRLGTYLGVPNVFGFAKTTTTGQLWPDTWIIEGGGRLAPREESVDSDEEIVMVKRKVNNIKFMQVQGNRDSALEDLSNRDVLWFEDLRHFTLDLTTWKGYNIDKIYAEDSGWQVTGVANEEPPPQMEQVLAQDVLDIMTSFHDVPIRNILEILHDDADLVINITFNEGINGKQIMASWIFMNSLSVRHWLRFDILERGTGVHKQYGLDVVEFYRILYRDIYSHVKRRSSSYQKLLKDSEEVFFPVHLDPNAFVAPDAPASISATSLVTKYEKQGLDKQPPTTAVLIWIIQSVCRRQGEDPSFNARMAFNEIEQAVETSSLDIHTKREGEPHQPVFYSQGEFLVENELFNHVPGTGSGSRKKKAEEKCCQEILSALKVIADQESSRINITKLTINDDVLNDTNIVEPANHAENTSALKIFSESCKMCPEHQNLLFNVITSFGDLLPTLKMKIFETMMLDFGYHFSVTIQRHALNGIGIFKVEVRMIGVQNTPSRIFTGYAPILRKQPGYLGKACAITDLVRSAITTVVMERYNLQLNTFLEDEYDVGL